MPYSDAELEQLYGDLAPTNNVTSESETPEEIQPTKATPFKRVKQIANIIPRAIGSTASSINELLSPGTNLGKQSEEVIPSFDVGESKGIADFALNEAAPSIASWMIPYLGITKVGKLAGLANAGRAGAGLLEAVGQGGANFLSSVGQPGANPTEFGVLGAVSGALQATLPRWQRALPLAAVSAAHMLEGGSALEAGANFVGNLLPGVHSITAPKLEPKAFDDILATLLPHDPNLVPTNLAPYHPDNGLAGTFSFMDRVKENSAVGTNDLGEAPLPIFEHTTLDQLHSPQLAREPIQMDLGLSNPEYPTTGLQLDHTYPIEGEASTIQPTNDTSLRLEGQTLGQPDLHPLLTLQGERSAPIHSVQNPGEFRFTNTLDPTATPSRSFSPTLFDAKVEAPIGEQPELALTKTLKQGLWNGENVGENPITALRMKDGRIMLDETARIHAQAFDNLKLNPVQVQDGGFVKGNQYFESGADSKRIIRQAEAKSKLQKSVVSSPPVEVTKSELPEVMTKDGFLNVEPKMEGPHIISTMVKDNDTGRLFAGENWKNTHNQVKAQDPEGLLATKFDLPNEVGEAEHMFLAQDEKGTIRPVNREDAGKIADFSEQRDPEYKGFPLQSEHLKEPNPTTPKTPEAVATTEKIKDKKVLASAKKSEAKIMELQQKLHDAQEAVRDGDVDAAIDVRTISNTIAKMKKAQLGEAGAISPELVGVLALGGVGGLVAYQQSKGDIGTTLAVAILAAGAGLAGVRALKALRSAVGPEVHVGGPKVKVNESLKAKITQLAKATTETPGGRAVFGRGGIWAGAIRMAEGLTGMNATPLFRDSKILADGFVAHQLEVLTKSLEAVRPLKTTDGFAEASARFIRGQLVDKPTVEAAIKSGGGVTTEAYSKLPSTAKAAYPEKWIVMDNPNNTNTSGLGVEVWHVSNTTKSKLVQMQKDALNNLAHSKVDKEFMQFPLQARETMDTLMQVVHDALPEGATRNKVLGTMGQYASRTHALLTDPKYYPTDVEIGRAMDRLAVLKEDRFINKYASATSIPGTIPITYNGTTHYVSSAAADEWAHLYTPEALRSLVSQYIHEIKQIASGKVSQLLSKDSEQLSSSLFARRKELDEVTQALLGTHTAPLELIQHTVNKLIPSTRSAHFMSDLIQMKDTRTGLQHAYKSEVAYNKAVNEIKHLLNSTGKTPAEIRNLETQLEELASYIPISGQSPRMGLFEGAYASRMAHDQLAGFTNPFGMLDNAIGHGLFHFNQIVKDTHLVANPIVHVRNAIQIPMFLAIGNAAAHPAAWKGAYEAMRNPLSKLGQRLTENGVFSGNVVHGEFNHSLHELLSGEADKSIYDLLKKGRGVAHKLYGAPDNFVRAAVYLAEETRAAKKFGVSIDANDPRVMQQARMFMSRRTMDYANVAQIIKTGRQVPFVSMFLSYTSEIMRIGRNLTVDALKGDLMAGATLGGLSALPFLAQSQAENSLSPVDRDAWDKTQNVVQDYSRVRFKLPLSRNKDGTFNYLDLTPLMPFNDFQMSARAIARGDSDALWAVEPFLGLEKTPLLSMFAEQITGKEIHSGKEFRNAGDRAWAIAKQLVPPHTPGIGSEYVKDVPESLGGNLGVTNLRNARTNTIEGTLARHITGMDYTQVNPSIAMKNYVAAAKRDIANERQYYMDVMLSSGNSVDAKKRATEKFVEAVNQITGQLQARLQLQPTNN